MTTQPDFISAPSKAYLKHHEELNDFVKISTAAIDHLSQSSPTVEELRLLIATRIKEAGERWTPWIYQVPDQSLSHVRDQLARSGIMWVFSAFDVFITTAQSSLSESAIAPSDDSCSAEMGIIKRLKVFLDSQSLSLEPLTYLLPLFELYTTARHCIVHNMGRADAAFRQQLCSSEFLGAMESWPTVIPDRELSPPPVINQSGKIQLRPHHAITYSDVCLRIVKFINPTFYSKLGPEPFIVKVTKESLLELESLRDPVCKDVYAYLSVQLSDAYGIKESGDETISIKSILEKRDLLNKAKEKYNALKAKG